MFRGSYKSKIDAKGRIKLPVLFYKKIQAVCDNSIVLSVHPDDNCLLLYTLQRWQELEEKINNLPSLNTHNKYLQRRLIGLANDCEIDNNQRMLVPVMLRDIANLDKKIIIIGQIGYLEIWDENLWNENYKELKEQKINEVKPVELMTLSI